MKKNSSLAMDLGWKDEDWRRKMWYMLEKERKRQRDEYKIESFECSVKPAFPFELFLQVKSMETWSLLSVNGTKKFKS